MQVDLTKASVTQAQEDTAAASLICIRDRLLREVKNERDRCLARAEASELREQQSRGVCCRFTQTDPVSISLPGEAFSKSSGCTTPVSSAGRTTAATLEDTIASLPGVPSVRQQEDDEAQAEAIRLIQRLGQRSEAGVEVGIVDLQGQIRIQRENVEEVKAELIAERQAKESAQQQVLVLKDEVEGYKAAIRVTERELMQIDLLDLQQATPHPERRSQASEFSEQVCPEARVMREQLLDLDSQLELKDKYICRLHSLFKQQSSVPVDDGSSTSASCKTGDSFRS